MIVELSLEPIVPDPEGQVSLPALIDTGCTAGILLPKRYEGRLMRFRPSGDLQDLYFLGGVAERDLPIYRGLLDLHGGALMIQAEADSVCFSKAIGRQAIIGTRFLRDWRLTWDGPREFAVLERLRDPAA